MIKDKNSPGYKEAKRLSEVLVAEGMVEAERQLQEFAKANKLVFWELIAIADTAKAIARGAA